MMIALYLTMVDTDEARDKITFIYENFYSFMAYTAGQVLHGNKANTEDAVHNAMMTLIENLDLIDFSDIRRAKHLCGIVAKNKAKDLCKSRENQALPLEDERLESLTVDDPLEKLVQHDTYNRILTEIRSMNDTYRDVLLLKYVHGMKEREIALILNLPPKTVNVRIFRGRQLLKTSLRKDDLYV